MSRRSITLPQSASWDLLVTSSGVNILVVAHGVSADRVIAADDGLVLGGERPVYLKGSGRASPYVRRSPRLVLVQAGAGRSLETVLPVVIHPGSIRSRNQHGQPAAA
jgi:hypothetical protein